MQWLPIIILLYTRRLRNSISPWYIPATFGSSRLILIGGIFAAPLPFLGWGWEPLHCGASSPHAIFGWFIFTPAPAHTDVCMLLMFPTRCNFRLCDRQRTRNYLLLLHLLCCPLWIFFFEWEGLTIHLRLSWTPFFRLNVYEKKSFGMTTHAVWSQ